MFEAILDVPIYSAPAALERIYTDHFTQYRASIGSSIMHITASHLVNLSAFAIGQLGWAHIPSLRYLFLAQWHPIELSEFSLFQFLLSVFQMFQHLFVLLLGQPSDL